MALTTFPTDMPKAVESVIRTANVLRFIRDSSGDLHLRALIDAQDELRICKASTLKAYAEGMKNPASAEAFMAGMNGPVSLAAFGAAMADIEGKASAWNTVWANWLTTLPAGAFMTSEVDDRDGVETRHPRMVMFVDELTAGTLRNSVELNDLITAFEAVGA